MNSSRYSPREVLRLLKEQGTGTLSLDNKYSRILSRSLSRLPREVVDWAMGNVIFISDLMIYSAFVINLGEAVSKGRKYLVVLGGELEGVPSNEQTLTIAHEIAHCYLNHQTFFPDSASIRESERRDEEDADKLAKHWLNE